VTAGQNCESESFGGCKKRSNGVESVHFCLYTALRLFSSSVSTLLSFTAAGVTPQSEEPRNLRRPKDQYELAVHPLIHNNVNTTVHKALFAYLSEDKSLYTSTASTLFFSLGRLGAGSLPYEFGNGFDSAEEIAPFQVESRLCEYSGGIIWFEEDAIVQY
jgi:hypothetical protein